MREQLRRKKWMYGGYILKLELSVSMGGQVVERGQGGVWIRGMSHWPIGGIIFLAGGEIGWDESRKSRVLFWPGRV